jgi:hypothetical protein
MAIPGLSGSLVVCLPGPLATWCNDLINHAALTAGMSVRHFDRSDDLTAGTPASIYLCQYPSISAIDAVRNARLNAVLIAQDPAWSIAEALQSGSAPLEAIRAVTASATANLAIGSTSRSRLVFPSPAESAAAVARRLLVAVGLPADPATIAAANDLIGRGLSPEAPLGDVLTRVSGRGQPAPLSEMVRDVVAKVTNGAMAMAQGERGYPIIWPTEVYFSGDRPNEPVDPISAVTGPSRVMIYGPYLHLPPARYTVEIIITFAGRIEDIPFLLELYGGETCLARVRLDGRKSGGYRGRFDLAVPDPVPPIEVRLRNERGAIEGEVALSELRFYVSDDERAFS